MRILPRTGLLSLVVPCALATDLSLPAELFSPLVAQKILATAQTVQSPVKYPQYTDRVKGVWDYFNPDTWTSGFFPSTLYALHERASLCPAPELNATDWLLLGQTWSAAEVPSETHTGVGHDVGFLSFPFDLELEMYVVRFSIVQPNTQRSCLASHPGNQSAIDAVNNFATELANRFNPIVGCTRSWDTSDPTDFQVCKTLHA